MTRRLSSLLGRGCLLACATLILACPPKRGRVVLPTDDGLPNQPSYEAVADPEADEALRRAMQVVETGSKDEAISALAQVRAQFPRTTASQEAHYQIGVLHFEAGEFALSRKAFNELLFDNPLFEKAVDAKLRLGLAALEVKAYRDAYQTLAPLADRITGSDRERALQGASEAAEKGALHSEALALAMRMAREATTEEGRAQAIQRVTDLVEGKVSFLKIAEAAQGLSASDPSWPIITFKLARVYYHLRDWSNLDETLGRFLAQAPEHPFVPHARELLARSRNRGEVNPNVVGVVLPLSGKYKLVGEAVLRGVQLALKDSPIELVVKDSQGDVNLAGTAVEELVFEQHAIAVLGPLLGDDSRRAALVAEELQIPIITLTRSEGVTAIGPHVFRHMLTNQAQAEALADYGTRVLGHQRFALLYPNVPNGVELVNGFWDELLQRGAEVRGAESYDHDQTTYTEEVKKLVGRYYLEDRLDYVQKHEEIMKSGLDSFRKRKAVEKLRGSLEPVIDFDVLLIPDDWRRVGLVTPALAVEDIITNACDPADLEKIRKTTGKKDLRTVTLFGTNQWSSPMGRSGVPELIERGGKFVMCSIYVDGFFVESGRRQTKRFVRAFRDAHKDSPYKDPGLLEAVGYDAAGMVRMLLEKKQGLTSRGALRDQLAQIKDYDGAIGATSMNEGRETRWPLYFLTITKDGIKELPPEKKPKTQARANRPD